MSKAVFWQKGESLDYTNATMSKIEANSVIVFGNRIGVAGVDIAPNETGSIHVTGVFEMLKTVTETIEMGMDVYFDGNGITNAKGDNTILAGYAAQSATANDTIILVKLIS